MMNMSTDEVLRIVGLKQLQIEALQKENFELRAEVQRLRDRYESTAPDPGSRPEPLRDDIPA